MYENKSLIPHPCATLHSKKFDEKKNITQIHKQRLTYDSHSTLNFEETDFRGANYSNNLHIRKSLEKFSQQVRSTTSTDGRSLNSGLKESWEGAKWDLFLSMTTY